MFSNLLSKVIKGKTLLEHSWRDIIFLSLSVKVHRIPKKNASIRLSFHGRSNGPN